MLRSVAGLGQHEQTGQRNPPDEGVPVRCRNAGVIVSAKDQHGHGGACELVAAAVCVLAERLGGGEVSLDLLAGGRDFAGDSRACVDALVRLSRRVPAGFGSRFEEEDFFVLEVVDRLQCAFQPVLLDFGLPGPRGRGAHEDCVRDQIGGSQ